MTTPSEPSLQTEPHLTEVLATLQALEIRFHQPKPGTSRAELEELTDPDFWEVGASGARYGRDYVLDALERRCANPPEEIWRTEDFHCREIGSDCYLLTYTLFQGPRMTRRSAVWRRHGNAWRMVYHQGTVATPQASLAG